MGKMGEVETGEPVCNADSTTGLPSPGLFPPLQNGVLYTMRGCLRQEETCCVKAPVQG